MSFSFFIIWTFCTLIDGNQSSLLFDEFEYSFDWDLFDEFPRLIRNSQKSQQCTERIPVIFKHLCVDWNRKRGFRFRYLSHINGDDGGRSHSQTNWFYHSRTDKIASAKNAAKYYNELNGDSFLMSDDTKWNEVSLFNDGGQTYTQCKTRPNIHECVHYDASDHKLTFNIKVPKSIHSDGGHPSKRERGVVHHTSAHSNFDNYLDSECMYACLCFFVYLFNNHWLCCIQWNSEIFRAIHNGRRMS